MLEQMRELGAPQSQIDEFIAQNAPDDLFIMEENEAAVRWFFSVDDLMARDGPVLLGLDVQAVQADAQMRGKSVEPKDYEKLRFLGRSAAYQFNSRRKWQ